MTQSFLIEYVVLPTTTTMSTNFCCPPIFVLTHWHAFQSTTISKIGFPHSFCNQLVLKFCATISCFMANGVVASWLVIHCSSNLRVVAPSWSGGHAYDFNEELKHVALAQTLFPASLSMSEFKCDPNGSLLNVISSSWWDFTWCGCKMIWCFWVMFISGLRRSYSGTRVPHAPAGNGEKY